MSTLFQTTLPELVIAYLPSQLPDTVDELDENRGAVCVRVVLIAVADALWEETGSEEAGDGRMD